MQYYLYAEQTAPAAAESRTCVRENCAIHFYGFLFKAMLLYFVPLADARALMLP